MKYLKTFLIVVAAFFAIGLVAAALAAVTLTEQQGPHELRDRDGTILSRHDSLDLCKEAAKAKLIERGLVTQQYRCVDALLLTATADCSDVPRPVPAVDADGFTDGGRLHGEMCPGTDQRYSLHLTEWVQAEAPSCAWSEQTRVVYACDVPPELNIP